MEKILIEEYERLFLLEGGRALSEAVKFILTKQMAKTQSEIAKKLGVSNATLTSYIQGNKTISKNFICKLQQVYKINLLNPYTYEDQSIYDCLFAKDLPPVDARNYLQTYAKLHQFITAQQTVIEGLKKTNVGLQRMMVAMYDVLIRHQKELTQDLMYHKN